MRNLTDQPLISFSVTSSVLSLFIQNIRRNIEAVIYTCSRMHVCIVYPKWCLRINSMNDDSSAAKYSYIQQSIARSSLGRLTDGNSYVHLFGFAVGVLVVLWSIVYWISHPKWMTVIRVRLTERGKKRINIIVHCFEYNTFSIQYKHDDNRVCGRATFLLYTHAIAYANKACSHRKLIL